jgi:3'(2'), 5'-bisphosphate nucleotidase
MLARIHSIAEEAGTRILTHYGDEIPVAYKADDSPLTAADRAAHRLIVDRLHAAFPEIPVLSEESDPEEIIERRSWRRFWLVDPLDGTKEFIKRTGQFTVNIALIEDGEPTLGVVYIPSQRVTYFAQRGEGAFRQNGDGEAVQIGVRKADSGRVVVVASRDHAGPEVAAILERIAAAGIEVESASMGSSLKFCLVAEGAADFYPRTGPTMEWDTAAAQCIVEEAGGAVTTLDGTRLRYNKESLRNPSFMAFGDAEADWQRFLA